MSSDTNGQCEPIAIIGLACRIPGGANDPESLSTLMRDGVDAVREISPDRYLAIYPCFSPFLTSFGDKTIALQ